MDLFHAFILGVVEGVTEFLPVSSTAHLIIASRILGLRQTGFVGLFEVFIQSGAILAVVVLYFRYLLEHRNLMKPVLYSFLPTAAVGFALYKVIKTVFFSSNQLIAVSLFIVALLFFALEYLVSRRRIKLKKSLDSLSPFEAVLTGLAQALAVVPGVSRSGIVMVYMMARGFKRDEAALYSFILAVPTILAASGYDLFKMRHVLFSSGEYMAALIAGFLVSFAVAYLVMKWFIGFLKSNSLVPFALYRIALAIIVMFLL